MAVPATPNFDQDQAKAAVNQQKAGLLAALAQGGTHMAQQQAAVQQQMAASSASAAQMAAARSVNPQQAAEARSAVDGRSAYYATLANAQAGAGTATMDTMSQVNSQYMDQLGASIPLAHAQAGREISSMRHAASQAQADRALRQQIAQMQLQETRERIAAAREKDNDPRANEMADIELQIARAKRDAILAGGGVDPVEAEKQAGAKKRMEMGARRDSALARQGPRAAQALEIALSGESVDYAVALQQLEAALGAVKTPGGKSLDRAYMQGVLAEIFGLPQAPPGIKGGHFGRSGRS